MIFVLIGLTIYYFTYYQGSQLQLNTMLLSLDNKPVDIYKDYPERKCGVWSEVDDRLGIDNNEVYECFQHSLDDCFRAVTLFIHQSNIVKEYSVIRTLGYDSEQNCIFQNTYYSTANELPAGEWSNSCVIVDPNPYLSCKP